ncbi:hypothetical protein J6590_076058 [Homalodisca vitripennis]|nr:hypothetical protein J6590_076058 [Homalodisca vitripennis]
MDSYLQHCLSLMQGGGLGLVMCGGLLLEDTERILTSRLILTSLPQPLFYYVALLLMSLGLILTALSVLGCWSAHLNNYCILSFYLFSLLILLVAECVVGVLALLCPQYLGLSMDKEDIKDNWQRTYGVPGREQYTAAIDLVQTKFQCCGIDNGNDFTASWWRLRELAPENLIVPLSCCIQQQPAAFLDPQPLNTSLCQQSSVENHRLARNLELGKAFDYLGYNLILTKLNRHGIQQTSLWWFESYLKGRSQDSGTKTNS